MVGSSFAVRRSVDLPEAEKGDVSFLKTFVFDYQYEDFGGGHRARRCDSHKPFLQLDGEIGLILQVLIIMQIQCSSTPPGHVAAFQAGNCPKGDSETFNRFPFGPTWALTMIEQRGDREYRRDQPTFHGYDRQQLRSASHAETRAAC